MSGDPDKVRAARDLVEDFLREQRRTNHVVQLRVPTAAFPFIIGAKGAVAQEIQQNSGAKFDLDRSKNLAIIRGRCADIFNHYSISFRTTIHANL